MMCKRKECYITAHFVDGLCDSCFSEWINYPGLFERDYLAFLITKPGSYEIKIGYKLTQGLLRRIVGTTIKDVSRGVISEALHVPSYQKERLGNDLIRIDKMVDVYAYTHEATDFTWCPNEGVLLVRRSAFERALKYIQEQSRTLKLIVMQNSKMKVK
jgi:hypothetical protein